MTDIPLAPERPAHPWGSPETAERRDLARFVARNPVKFMPLYDARKAGRRWVPFCWPGFLFPQAWFLYRKMYLWAALTSAGPLLTAQWLHSSLLVSLPISILGLFGRALYLVHARDALRRIRATAGDEAEALDMIARAGGVSRLGGVLGALFALAALASSGRSAMGPP